MDYFEDSHYEKLGLLREVHDYLDDLNARDGEKARLCLVCGSSTYNSKKGIIHEDGCLLQRIRWEIA